MCFKKVVGTVSYISNLVNSLRISFTDTFCGQFATKTITKVLPHPKHVATLLCETGML